MSGENRLGWWQIPSILDIFMTKEEAEFERNISDQIVREVAKNLGYKRVRFREMPTEKFATAYITRIYGQRLVIPQNGGEWDMTLTVTLWNGKVKADVGYAERDGGVYCKRSVELEYDAADPGFLDDITKRCREVLNRGRDSAN